MKSEEPENTRRGVRLPHFARGRSGRRLSLLIGAPVLAIALAASVLPRGTSSAAEFGGIQYSAGEARDNAGDGSTCSITLPISLDAKDAATQSQVAGFLAKAESSAALGSGVGQIRLASVTQTSGSLVNLVSVVDLDCALVQSATAAVRTTGSEPSSAGLHATAAGGTVIPAAYTGSMVVRAAALPQWAKNAVAALGSAAVYVAVTVVVVAVLSAALPELAAALGEAAASAAVTVVGGCIGGAVSTAVNNLITGAASNVAENVSSAVSGCITGGAIASMGAGLKAVSASLSNGIRGMLGLSVAEVGGATLATAETELGHTVGIHLEQVVTAAAEGAGRAAA